MRADRFIPRLVRGAAVLGVLLGLGGACGRARPTARDAGENPACAAALCGAYRCEPQFGHCLTTCQATADCVDGFVCEAGFCVGTDCTANTAAARCGAYACVLGRCSRDCAQGPCNAGFYCGDTGECLAKCASRYDVVCGGFACDVDAGECEPYCLDGELECSPGYACTAAMTCAPP